MQTTNRRNFWVLVAILALCLGFAVGKYSRDSFKQPETSVSPSLLPEIPEKEIRFNDVLVVKSNMVLQGKVRADRGINIEKGATLFLKPGCQLTLHGSRGWIWCAGSLIAVGKVQKPISILNCGGIVGKGMIEMQHVILELDGVPTYEPPLMPKRGNESTEQENGCNNFYVHPTSRSVFPYMILADTVVIDNCKITILNNWRKRILQARKLKMSRTSVRHYRRNRDESRYDWGHGTFDFPSYQTRIEGEWKTVYRFTNPAFYSHYGEIDHCSISHIVGPFAGGKIAFNKCELIENDTVGFPLSHSRAVSYTNCAFVDCRVTLALETIKQCVFKKSHIASFNTLHFGNRDVGELSDSFIVDSSIKCYPTGSLFSYPPSSQAFYLNIFSKDANLSPKNPSLNDKRYLFDGCYLLKCRWIRGYPINIDESIVEECMNYTRDSIFRKHSKHAPINEKGGGNLIKDSCSSDEDKSRISPIERFYDIEDARWYNRDYVSRKDRDRAKRMKRLIIGRMKNNLHDLLKTEILEKHLFEYSWIMSRLANSPDYWKPRVPSKEWVEEEEVEDDF